MTKNEHYSVMLKETISSLNIKPNGTYVDLTMGMGGHSIAILKRLNNEGKLICFDKDKFAISITNEKLKVINSNYILIHSDFSNLKNELKKHNINSVDGIIADLGMSSPQIDNPERGFSYSQDAYLDMRMNQDETLDAYKVVNSYSEQQLNEILYNYADVKLAKQVAKAIVKNRPIKTTFELVKIVKEAYPAALLREKNPAKAIFQAIRIEVNHEYDSIKSMLEQSIELLKPNSSLSIITFHSGEDRIVKNFFGNLIKSKIPNKMPIIEEKKYLTKSIYPSNEEIEINNRSRTAKLRILTKLK
ncbi:MAG: 16S rRNA (cytosine(1402)-N(4))-methyltransferase RsmH [Metamycoplasmataceae bacterium]